MPHPSPEDPEDHSTIYLKDSAGRDVYVGHVTSDAGKQQASLFRIRSMSSRANFALHSKLDRYLATAEKIWDICEPQKAGRVLFREVP